MFLQSTKLNNIFRSPLPKTATMKPTSPEMDPQIWSRLPEELLERILCFLPLNFFLLLRSTCKLFNSLLFSPSFVSDHSPALSSFLLLSHPQSFHNFPLYDSVLGAWRSLPLPSPVSQPSSLLCSSNGLLCFSLPNSSSFLVCNFLPNSSRIIEFPTYPSFAFELLTLVSCSRGYKIFMLSSGPASRSAFVYDSAVQSWSRFDVLDLVIVDNHHQEGALFNGCLYFTTPEPFSIGVLDMETGDWRRSGSQLPRDLTFVRLVSDGEGKLYMVGGIGGNGISRSIKIWEMSEGEEWEEMERLPEGMCRKMGSVCYHNYEHVYCLWHQGTICICCYTWPEILFYKVSTRAWDWLPKCPQLPDQWSCGFRWFSFVPQLYASV